MEPKDLIAPRPTIGRKLKSEQRRIQIRRLSSNKLMVIGSIFIFILLLVALLGPVLTPYSPYEMEISDKLQAPSAKHLLGTDEYGRDLFTRIAYGAQTSLSIGIAVSAIATLAGVVIGLYASFYIVLDNLLMRIMDSFMAFPSILLAISLMAALGPKTGNVILALSIVFTPYVARITRSAALAVKEETYIEAMRAQGASSFRIIWRHIAPNVLSPIVVQATFIFADAIITEASLSFLGAGVPSPSPSWGNILYDGKAVIFSSQWMVIFSGLVIVMSVLGLNLLGDGIRDLLDPRIKGRIKPVFRIRR